MPVVRRDDRRRIETPNAVMTTLASPTLGGARDSIWQVEMRPSQAGPEHTFDTEQVWTVLDGGATIELEGERLNLSPGDTIVIPPALSRRVTADASGGLTAIVAARAGARAATVDGKDRGVPDWLA